MSTLDGPPPEAASRGVARSPDGWNLGCVNLSPVPPPRGAKPARRSKSRPGIKLLTLAKKDVLLLDEVAGRSPVTGSSCTSTLSAGNSRNSAWSRTSSALGDRGQSSPSPAGQSSRFSPLPCAWSQTPSWSMRYCQYVGSSVEDSGKRDHKENKTTSSAFLLDDLGLPLLATKSQAQESVFLHKRAPDKRITKLVNSDVNAKTSRLVARRGAITNYGTSRLQVNLAVKIMFARHPGHMRKLLKYFAHSTGAGFVAEVEAKALSSTQVSQLAEQIGMTNEEIQTLYGTFNRYDIDGDGCLSREELKQGLADLGLQPVSREEKLEVQEILCDHDVDGLGFATFDDYLSLVKTIRERLRHIQHATFMQAFVELDVDSSKSMDQAEALELLSKKMGLCARNEDEADEIAAIFSSVDTDGDGQVGSHQCHDFVQRVRAKISIMRREEEMKIAKAFHLGPVIINEFRMDLPMIWELFNRYDHNSTHSIIFVDLMPLLMDFGVAPAQLDSSRMTAIEFAVSCHGKPENDFTDLLHLIHECRMECRHVMGEELEEKFKTYARQNRSELGRLEIFHILEDFHMLPRSRDEQADIANVIERLDEDGSGTFNFIEFVDFFERLTEQVDRAARKRELKACKALGFSDEQITILRRQFLLMGPDAKGRVGQLEMAHSLPVVAKHHLFPGLDEQRIKDLIRRAQQAPEHGVEFTDFIKSVINVYAVPEEASSSSGTGLVPHGSGSVAGGSGAGSVSGSVG